MPTHHYSTRLDWTGNRGSGTSGYRDYARDHTITAPGRPALLGSSDPLFRGVLRPAVTISGSAPDQQLTELHHRAHELCFIANSVKFPVRCEQGPVTRA